MVLSMKDFPSCLGENGVQVADSSQSLSSNSNKPENLVKCIYKCQSQSFSGFITLTWIKPHLMGPVLSIEVENSSNEHLCKVDIKPWLMLSKRRGINTLQVDPTSAFEIQWDFSYAKFGSSPEPLEAFYLTIVLNGQEPLLHVGDKVDESFKKMQSVSRAILVAKREHVLGKRCFTSRAQFCDRGTSHNVKIEYDPSEKYDKCLVINVDDEPVLQVMRLKWKFRGNYIISVDGIEVEVYLDVHNWIFGVGGGNAIFLFRTRGSGGKLRADPVLTWPGLKISKEQELHGFSMVLCAWRNE